MQASSNTANGTIISAITSELDSTYSQLAIAIHQAGNRSELFLAMLSLKLITQLPAAQAQMSIAQTLADLDHHDPIKLGQS